MSYGIHTDNSHRAIRTWTFSNALIKYCFSLIYILDSPETVNYECSHHLFFSDKISHAKQIVSKCKLLCPLEHGLESSPFH